MSYGRGDLSLWKCSRWIGMVEGGVLVARLLFTAITGRCGFSVLSFAGAVLVQLRGI